MLSYGTKEIKYIVCALFLILLLSIMILHYNKGQIPDSDFYCERMLSLLEKSNEVMLSEVFDFEFDSAYVSHVINEVYSDEKHFINKLDVTTTVSIPVLESGGHYRILFIKDDEIVYDFIYDSKKICFLETGMLIFPDTVLALEGYRNVGNDITIAQINIYNIEK